MPTVMEIVQSDQNLTKLLKCIKAAGLEETLSGVGPFTILAPVNLAFGNMEPISMDEMLKPANKEKLTGILSYHLLAGKKMMRDFTNGQKLKTIHDKEVNITVKDGEVHINGSMILNRDRQAFNGVVHSVNSLNMHYNPLHKV
jgi:uncharacterized surface protein with fasciclin (FAS1) repeats